MKERTVQRLETQGITLRCGPEGDGPEIADHNIRALAGVTTALGKDEQPAPRYHAQIRR